jgi:hypothetical protein
MGELVLFPIPGGRPGQQRIAEREPPKDKRWRFQPFDVKKRRITRFLTLQRILADPEEAIQPNGYPYEDWHIKGYRTEIERLRRELAEITLEDIEALRENLRERVEKARARFANIWDFLAEAEERIKRRQN